MSLMALTGTLDPLKKETNKAETKISIQGMNCRIPSAIQILLFLFALGLTITCAIKAL